MNEPLVLLASLASAEGVAPALASLKKSLREAVAEDPFEANLVTVAGGAFLFYLAEKGKNPKVQTYWDALVFVSTCMSVGYADVFARTPAGQAIASAVMTLGPAMSGAILDEPKAPESIGRRAGSTPALSPSESIGRRAGSTPALSPSESIGRRAGSTPALSPSESIGRRAGSTPALSPSESIAVQRVIVDKLEAILVELRALREKA